MIGAPSTENWLRSGMASHVLDSPSRRRDEHGSKLRIGSTTTGSGPTPLLDSRIEIQGVRSETLWSQTLE